MTVRQPFIFPEKPPTGIRFSHSLWFGLSQIVRLSHFCRQEYLTSAQARRRTSYWLRMSDHQNHIFLAASSPAKSFHSDPRSNNSHSSNTEFCYSWPIIDGLTDNRSWLFRSSLAQVGRGSACNSECILHMCISMDASMFFAAPADQRMLMRTILRGWGKSSSGSHRLSKNPKDGGVAPGHLPTTRHNWPPSPNLSAIVRPSPL